MPRPAAPRARFIRLALRLLAALLAARISVPAATREAVRTFDVPAGEAGETLRRTAQQGGVEIVFLMEVVRGIRTAPVRGEFTPREALDRLVRDTGLIVARDPSTGTLTVNRPASPPVPPRKSNPPSPMNPKPAPRRTGWISALLALATAPLAAGQATAGTGSATAAEPTVVLSPFLVTTEAETGYAATNTLDGSRLNTALRDTPAAISIFTRDFLDDIAATDVPSLLRYDLSSEIEFGDANADGTGMQVGSIDGGPAWRTRGLGASASTNGFRDAGGVPDLYNVERVGSNRGPNAILFGTGASGGVLNLRTKTADPRRNRNSVEFRVGTHDTQRTTFDLNRAVVKDKFALRVMGLYDHKGSHIPHVYSEKFGATVAAQLKVSEHTQLNLSFDKNQSTGVGGRPWGMSDSITLFLSQLASGAVRFDAADGRYETANGAVVGATSGVGNLAPNRNVVVYGPGGPAGTLHEGASATVNRSTLATTASVFTGAKPVVPESIARYGEVNASGPSEYGEVDHRIFNATLNHRLFRNAYVELAYNYAHKNVDSMISANPELRADLDYRLPGGALNPYFHGNGYYFSQIAYIRQLRSFTDETFRASVSYEFDLKRLGQHRFAALGERHINQNTRYRLQEVWEGAPFGGNPEAVANRVQRRRYFRSDGPLSHYSPGHLAEPFQADSYASAFGHIGTLRSGWAPLNDLDSNDEVTTDSQLFVMQNFLFNRRLVTTAGLRLDRINTFAPRSVRDATTRKFRFATAADQAFFAATGRSWFEDVTLDGDRRSLGAVFHLTRNFSLAANASDGIQLAERNRTVLPDERVPDPFKGEGRDYGLNFSFLDNRLSGSVRYFESSSLRENSNDKIQQVFIFPNNDVMASFDYYYRQAGLTNLAGAPIASLDDLRTIYFSDADSYMSDRKSDGYEFELVANPTRSWSVRMGYSWTDRTRTNVMNEGEPWWAGRLALWQSLDTFYTQRTGRPSVFTQTLIDRNDAVTNLTVNQRIAQSDAELADVRREEEQGYGNRRHKANVWTRYAFTEGRLRGAAIGGGYRYQSKNIAGVNTATNEVLYGNPTSLFDLFLQYRTKGFLGRWADRTGVTYQLNVTNLLDDRTINITRRSSIP